ncbi:hypothetical protein PFISCL1PPCAC_23408, partial [Pristionchus fissidentatus]
VQMEIGLNKEQLEFMAEKWPSHYGTLFDMGITAWDQLFAHNPTLKKHFDFVENDPTASWKEDERIKKMVLSLQQLLTDAVNTLGYGEAAEMEVFVNTLRELGGLHRNIVESVNPQAFLLLFALLPEVIADVTSNRRKSGPLPADDRQELIKIWKSITAFMGNQIMLGWERNKIPTSSKYLKSYLEKCPHAKVVSLKPASPTVKSASPPGFIPDNYKHVVDEDVKNTTNSISLRHVALSPLSALRK